MSAAGVRTYYRASDSKNSSGESLNNSLRMVYVGYSYFIDENCFATFATVDSHRRREALIVLVFYCIDRVSGRVQSK